MTAVQTLVFDAYDAYLDLHKTTWADLADKDAIYDGPQPVIPTDPVYAIIGCDDPTIDGFMTSVDQGNQEWESLGASARMETFTIWSTLVAWTGDNNFPALRAEANTRITDLGVALSPPPRGTGDAMLNNVLNSGGVGWCGLTIARFRVKADPDGFALHILYSLACTARI